MSPSNLKLMYQNFNWRFWTDDGMRKQTDNGELDPHYREMMKVIDIPYLVNVLMSHVVIVPRRSKQLVFCDAYNFYRCVTCDYIQD